MALYHGLVRVARSTAGHPPSFDLDPLDTDVTDPVRLAGWFRRFCEVRADGAAERTLRAAVAAGLPSRDLVGMLAAACTDHRFLDGGHALDFGEQGFRTARSHRWAAADEVLPALIPAITGGARIEETSAWRDPVDLAAAVEEALDGLTLPAPRPAGMGGAGEGWGGHADLAVRVLDDEPTAMLAHLADLVRAGVR